jgi:hypothetical protein
MPQHTPRRALEKFRKSGADPAFAERRLARIASSIKNVREIEMPKWKYVMPNDQQRPTPAASFSGDDTANTIESARSGSPEDGLRYLRETQGENDAGE